MATPEELWGARSADAKAFADSLISTKKPKRTRTKTIDLASTDAPIYQTGVAKSFNDVSEPENWWETPIVKGVIDALSVGTYTSAATANSLVESARAAKGKTGLDAIGAYLGEGVDQLVNHNPAVMGIKGAFGDDDSKRTYADVIKNAQSAGISEDYSNSEQAKTVQGVGGLIGDIALDPLWLVPGAKIGAIAGGALKGANKAALAAKETASGGEALGRVGEGMGRIESRLAGVKSGAKEGLDDYKALKLEEANLRAAKKGIRNGDDIGVYKEDIRGYAHLPEDVLAGVRKPSNKDIRNAAKAERKAAKTKPIVDDLIPSEPKYYGDFITPASSVGKIDIPTEVIDLSAKAADDVPVDVPMTPKQMLDNPQSIVPKHDYVDDPGKLDPALFIRDTPVDQFVKGTAHLTSDVPRIAKKKQIELQNFIAAKVANGEKVMPSQLRRLGFKGTTHEAMKMIRSGGMDLNKLTRKSGGFKAILNDYRKGNLPVEDMAKFEEFASTFFKLEGADRLNKDRILELATDFVEKNADQLAVSSMLHAPTAQAGRLSTYAVGGKRVGGMGEANGLLRILPPDSAMKYSRPFREDERIEMVTHLAQKAEADIANGLSPEVVGKIADKIIDEHFTEYATKSGDFVTRDGWHTSTTTLQDGLPKKEFFWTTHSAIDLFSKLNTEISAFMKNIPELDAIRAIRGKSKQNEKNYQIAYRSLKDDLAMRALAHVDANLKAHNIFGYLTNVMEEGGVAIRLSMYDVMDAIGPELRMRHMWTVKGDINNLRPTQIMNVAESLIRMLSGSSIDGAIDSAKMLQNAREILKGNYAKTADAAGIVRFIEKNLDEQDKLFNGEIIEAAGKGGASLRNAKYTQFIKAVMEKVGPDDLTSLQRLADTALRNSALHASQYSSKIVYATEQQMKRLTDALEFGTVGNFSDVISSVVRPDKFEPEVSKLFGDEIRTTNLTHTSPDELAVADEMANVSRISTGKELVLYTAREMGAKTSPTEAIAAGTYHIPTGPKPKINPNRLKLSTANASEVMLNGMRILSDGKTVAQKWSIKPWVSRELDDMTAKINTANAKVASRIGDTRLHPDVLPESLAKHSSEELANFMRIELGHDVARRWFVGQRMFNVRFGKEISYEAVTSGMHLSTALETAFHSVLNDYARRYPVETARQAFKDLQSPTANIHELIAAGKTEGMSPALIEMAQITGHVFDPSTNNFFVRNGIGPKHINAILRNNNVNDAWRFPTMVDGKLVTPDQMSQVWKTWTNIENPYKALAAIHTAMNKASSDVSMGARFSSRFGLNKVPVGEEGNWAKLGDYDKVDNSFLDLIDKELYYPKEIISEIPELGQFITASRTFKNEKFQQWVNSFDEFTSALKITQTAMKPGHHVMSIIGNFFTNRLAGVNGTTHSKDSWRIIRTRNDASKELSELDNYAKIKSNSVNLPFESAPAGKSSTNIIINGRKIGIDDSTAYDMFTQRGIFVPPHNPGVAEDLLAGAGSHQFTDLAGGTVANTVSKAASKTNRAVSGVINNKFIKVNDFTAQRDNLFRGEMAIHAMKSKNFKSVEEALDFAEAKVRKWYPTARDLTAMESKYNRRLFLYYTWLRGMIPRVVEGIVANPNVAAMPSKAMYNTAIANGLDPTSIGDPFDPNVLMPEYYTKGILGPQWSDPNSGHLWGLNPTSPVIDVFNSIGGGSSLAGMNPFQQESNYDRIGRTLIGMTNPIFRSPFELAMGRNIGTDTPIMDDGQYATDMVGPARFASKITGHTLNPMLGGIPRRSEARFKEGIAEDDWWNNAGLETANFMTGLQFKDYTSDSATKSAEFDQRAKEKLDSTNEMRSEWWK